MGVQTDKNKLLITKPKTFHFDLPKDFDYNLKHKIDNVMKYFELLTKQRIKKMRFGNYCPNISMETIFMNTENSKRNVFLTFCRD